MNNYQPNFNDPRVRRRCQLAIEFVERYIDSTPVPVAQSQIIKHFGNPGLPLGSYLKNALLICTDTHWNMLTGKCKRYVRNSDGLRQLRHAVNPRCEITPEQQQQLTTGEFQLEEKSDRFYNPLQLIPRYKRDPLMQSYGYNYLYDIRCAAPTLLYQLAQQIQPSLKLDYIEDYIINRSLIRKTLSEKLDIEEQKIKTVITALFQGAYLSHNNTTRIYHLLEGRHYHIDLLKNDPWLIAIKEEIKEMWTIIGKQIKEDKISRRGNCSDEIKQEILKQRLTGRDKAAKYRELERAVMHSIRRELRRTKNDNLPIHDGWYSRKVCDMKRLRELVKERTGYLIEIDWTILSQL